MTARVAAPPSPAEAAVLRAIGRDSAELTNGRLLIAGRLVGSPTVIDHLIVRDLITQGEQGRLILTGAGLRWLAADRGAKATAHAAETCGRSHHVGRKPSLDDLS